MYFEGVLTIYLHRYGILNSLDLSKEVELFPFIFAVLPDEKEYPVVLIIFCGLVDMIVVR